MTLISPYLSIITLNVDGLNSSVKRHRVAEQIKRQDPIIFCLQEIHFSFKDSHWLKVQERKKIFHTNGNRKRAGVAILYHIKQSRLEAKNCKKRQWRPFHNDKGSIHQVDITIKKNIFFSSKFINRRRVLTI